MKKTLSIHLGRQLFTIEEDAYERLQQYLHRLEQSLNAEEGIAEIMEDIEMRFAELIVSYLGETRKVVNMNDVETGIASLGEPEVISEETEPKQEQRKETTAETSTSGSRRLYRDPENSMLGGVCAGLAAYLNIDPVIMRIIFVILFFTGTGVPAYILFWIIVPSAVTPSDRLRMQGKAVTVDTLKEEFVKATDRIKDDTQRARDRFKAGNDPYVKRAKFVLHQLGRIAGFGMIALSLLWLVFYTLFISGAVDVIPASGDTDYLSVREFFTILIPVDSTRSLMWAGILLTGFLIPATFILLGIRLLTDKYRRPLKIALVTSSLLVAVGFICGFVAGMQTGRDMAVYAEVEQQHLTLSADDLVVEEIPHYVSHKRILSTGGMEFLTVEHGRIYTEGILVTYRASDDSLFHIYQVYQAHGVDRNSALKRCNRIKNTIELKGNKLMIDPYYNFPKQDGLRNQEIQVIIEVPKDKLLHIKDLRVDNPDHEYNGMLYANEPFDTWE